MSDFEEAYRRSTIRPEMSRIVLCTPLAPRDRLTEASTAGRPADAWGETISTILVSLSGEQYGV